MGVFETYAKRKRVRETAGQDVYEYIKIPVFLRKQIGIILHATLGPWDHGGRPCGNDHWCFIAETLEREIPTFPDRSSAAIHRCLNFLECSNDADDWLSLLEVSCRVIDYLSQQSESMVRAQHGATQNATDALQEINARFRENGFGYQYENGDIIRMDDKFVHAEIIKPVLGLLAEPGFEKANEEFLTAHRHYRTGHDKDAIVAAGRAYEATLKAICKARRWKYPNGARVSDLIATVRKNGLFPAYLDNGLDTYVAMIKTGLPGVRNNAGGHGEDPDTPSVPSYMASYAIHLTAANILLALNAFKKS